MPASNHKFVDIREINFKYNTFMLFLKVYMLNKIIVNSLFNSLVVIYKLYYIGKSRNLAYIGSKNWRYPY
jgi:hypothetical protein